MIKTGKSWNDIKEGGGSKKRRKRKPSQNMRRRKVKREVYLGESLKERGEKGEVRCYLTVRI